MSTRSSRAGAARPVRDPDTEASTQGSAVHRIGAAAAHVGKSAPLEDWLRAALRWTRP